MLRLKLTEPFEQVYVYISLENPLTGQVRTIDAKVDTGAAVTIIPKDVIDGLELPLKLCNFSQWHEWEKEEHSVYFEIELLGEEVLL